MSVVYTGPEFTTTATGNVDDLDFANASIIRMNNASLATIRGLKAGVPGQRVTIVSVGAGQVNLSHQDTGDATASSRLICKATSGKTPLAAGTGTAVLQCDGTTARWRLVSHDQGGWITPAYSAGNFASLGGGTAWTVIAANQDTYAYMLVGKLLTVAFRIESTNVTGAPLELLLAVPGGFSVAKATNIPFQAIDKGAAAFGIARVAAADTSIRFQSSATGAGWQATAGSDTFTRGTIFFEVT